MSPVDSGPSVRGFALLGVLKQISVQHGDDQRRTLVSATGLPQLSRNIEADQFYPYEVFTDLLQKAADVFAEGDLSYCRTLGYVASKHDLNSAFRALVRLGSPERLVEAFGSVWSWYYREAGTLRVVSSAGSETVVRIEEFPQMHPAHVSLMEGWFAGGVELLGADVHPGMEVRHEDAHEFRFSWTRSEDEPQALGFATVRRA